MVKYQKWLDKNTHLLTNKLAIVVGGTGSIGSQIVDYLLYLKAKVIIAARNVSKANELKNKLLIKYQNAKIYVEELDISSLESIDKFQLVIDQKYPKADIFINNAGVYHLPNGMSKDGYEIHFATNALGSYYLSKKIIFDLKDDAKIIYMGSLSYNFSKVNFHDIQSLKVRNKTKKYGLTKRIMTFNACNLKRQLLDTDINVAIAHPGVCATELFTKSHSWLFLHTVYPLMRVIFHSKEKAALSIIKAIFVDTKIDEWVGPRGLFHAWGYPKVYRLNKAVYDEALGTKVDNILNDMIKKHLEK